MFLMIAGLATMFAFGQKIESRLVSDFTGINASGAFEITAVKGSEESLTIETSEELIPYVRSEVKNGILRLYLEKSTPKKLNSRTVKATVVMKDLDKVSLSGACNITANDLFTPKSFNADCSGSSGLAINVNTEQLSIEASGASKIQMKASVTGDTKMDVSGSSNIQGELKANNVNFSSSGACKLNLTGSATDVIIGMSGSSNFNAGDFTARAVTVKSSGSSNVTVNATDVLNVNSTGSSTVNYKGSPAITIKSSGSSKVKKI